MEERDRQTKMKVKEVTVDKVDNIQVNTTVINTLQKNECIRTVNTNK